MTSPVFRPIRVVDTPETHAAVIWRELSVDRLAEAQESRPAMLREAGAAGLDAGGRMMTVWRLLTPDRIRIAPGLLLEAPFAEVGSLTHLVLPAGTAAHLRLEGSFEHLSEGWERLFTTCHAQGWRPSGLNWEIYENDETEDQRATDLYAQLG